MVKKLYREWFKRRSTDAINVFSVNQSGSTGKDSGEHKLSVDS